MTTAKSRMGLSTFVGSCLSEEDGNVLREGVRALMQALIENTVVDVIGAERH